MAKISDKNDKKGSGEKQPFEPLFIPKDLAKAKIEEAARELKIPDNRLAANIRELDKAKSKAIEMIKPKEGETRSEAEVKYYNEVADWISAYPN